MSNESEREPQRPLILIVDDSPIIVNDYTSFFEEEHGFEVLSAMNKEDAISMVEALTRPAVLILDRMLYDAAGNSVLGEDLLPELKIRARYRFITILHSGDNSESAVLSSIHAGAYWYLPKGGSQELFMAYIWLARDVVKEIIEPNQDPLTQALNRRAMFDRVTRELSRARRFGSTTACLMYDLNKFKSINDQYGHATGDEVIASAFHSVREHLRHTDVVCRYGGDEILVFLFEVDERSVPHFAKSSCLTISEKRIRVKGSTEEIFVSVGATVGWATLSPQAIEEAVTKEIPEISHSDIREERQTLALRGALEQLINAADQAMYAQKIANRAEKE